MGQGAATPPGRKITVLIVDDHRIFRQGVQVNLEMYNDITVVGHGATGEQGLELIRDLRPDIAMMDINLPGMNGIQVTRQITADALPTRVVILTAYDDTQQMIYAMRAGASAYCVKEIEPDKLVEVLRFVLRGNYVIGTQVLDKTGLEQWIDRGVQSAAGPYYADMSETMSPLSPREMEILQCVTRGLSNKEIALTLKISHQTVKNHMTAILRKLAVEDRTQAAVFALQHGWVRLKDASDD